MEAFRHGPEMVPMPAPARSRGNALDRTITLDVHGTRQRVRVCAERRGLPPVLVVQAGPGLPLLNEVAKFRARLKLERDFTVAYWDQRGCGEAPLRDARSVSVRTQVDDVCAMIRWLGHQTGQPVVVLAVSLGATFALQAVAREPSNVKALVAVSIDTDLPAADAAAADFLEQAAAFSGRASLAKSVESLEPPPYLAPGPFQWRARLLTDLGGIERVSGFGELMRSTLFSLLRTYGVVGTVTALRNLNAVQRKLLPEIATLDLFGNWPHYGMPVHYVFGSDDALVPVSLAQRVLSVAAKGDSVRVVPGARHMVHFDAPEVVREVIVQAHGRVAPQARVASWSRPG